MAQRVSGTILIALCCVLSVGTQEAYPDGTIDEIVYGYLATPRECQGEDLFEIPVYVSIPPATPMRDKFSLLLDGASIALHRADESLLVGQFLVEGLPREFQVQCTRNDEPIGPASLIALENGYQAVTLSFSELEGVESGDTLGDEFVRAAALQDWWGGYVYGMDAETGVTHTRHFFGPTFTRLQELGCEHVYVFSTLHLDDTDSSPRVVPFDATIAEEDLDLLVLAAHEAGLQFHLVFNFWLESDEALAALTTAPKSTDWIDTLFDSYEAELLKQVLIANRCGVDSVVVNWLAAFTSFRGYEDLWWSRWRQLIDRAESRFGGELEYVLITTGEGAAITTGRIPIDVFAGIDSFIFSPDPKATSYDDGIEALRESFTPYIANLEPLRDVLGRPLLVWTALQSYDGYLVDGFQDAAIGRIRTPIVDFFEQARGYEALLQVVADSGAIDGLIVDGYHYDDAFGPDLGMFALARYDLDESVRNKPAEAILKRWFGGIAGPASMISTEESAAMNRPWCQDDVGPRYSIGVYRVIPASDLDACASFADDFEEDSSLAPEWIIDFDYQENHSPGTDPNAYCVIERQAGASGGTHLAVDYSHSSWMNLRYWGERIDVSELAGIEITLWSANPMEASIGLGASAPNIGWKSGDVSKLHVSREPRRFQIPFEAFLNPYSATPNEIQQHLDHFVMLGIGMSSGANTLYLDDICFYAIPD